MNDLERASRGQFCAKKGVGGLVRGVRKVKRGAKDVTRDLRKVKREVKRSNERPNTAYSGSMEASVASLPGPHVLARSSAVAWPAVLFVIGATRILAGLLWGISWDKTIGRDAFWAPAGLLIHFGGITAGLTGAFLILRTTFGSDASARAASVKVWGFRGPLGAWLSIWGCFAMLTAAPFDDWWHNAYGLAR